MALVINRRWGESFLIGAALVTVSKSSGNHVSLRVEAPPEVRVIRTELIRRPKPDKKVSVPALDAATSSLEA